VQAKGRFTGRKLLRTLAMAEARVRPDFTRLEFTTVEPTTSRAEEQGAPRPAMAGGQGHCASTPGGGSAPPWPRLVPPLPTATRHGCLPVVLGPLCRRRERERFREREDGKEREWMV